MVERWKQFAANSDGTKTYDKDGNRIDYSNRQITDSDMYVPPHKQKNTPSLESPEVIEARRQYEKRDNNRVSAWIARELTKPAFKGLAAIPDIPVVLNNLILAGVNKFAGTQVEGLKLPSEHVGDAIDYVTDGMSVSDPYNEDGIVAKGVEFGTSMAGGGLIGKAAKAIAPASKAVQKVSPWLGSTKGGDIGTAAVMGAATQGAEDIGFDPVTSTAIGMGVGIAPSMIGNKLLKGKVKNFNLEAYDAAQAQDIDLPKVSLDQSTTSKLARTAGEHTLYAGSKLADQSKNTKLSFKKAFEKNLNKNSVADTLESRNANKALYEESQAALKDTDAVIPSSTLSNIRKAKDVIKADGAVVGTDKEKKYLRDLEELSNSTKRLQTQNAISENGSYSVKQLIAKKNQILSKIEKIAGGNGSIGHPLTSEQRGQKIELEKAYTDIEVMIKDVIGREGQVPISKLIKQKQLFNKHIDSLPKEEWLLKRELRGVRDGIKADIENYAKNNKEFGEKWKSAEKLYGDIATRKEVNEMLGIKEELRPELTFNPKKIAGNYKNLRGDDDFIKLIGGQKNLKGFDDIVTAAAALPNSEVSTLAKNMKIMAMLSGGPLTWIGAISGGTSGAVFGAASQVGVEVLAHLFSKKNTKALDKLAQYARNQTPENAKIVKNTYKKELGKSVGEVNNSLEQLIKDSRKAKTRLGAEELAKSIGED